MLITDAIPYPTFANHESFHLRYGWLKKAYNAVIGNPEIFVSDDAPITLGVGKNMVRSMRFWALANKMIVPQGKITNPKVEPTRMGDAIFQDRRGLDPYLEDPQTLWLLHWLLFAPPCRIPVWWIIINEFTATNVRIEEMTEYVQNRITNMSEWHTPSPKSVKKDIDVFVHTYTTNQGKLTIEDYLDCPFRQMRMVKQSSRDTMRFVIGKKYGMTPDIVAFACLDFIIHLDIKSKSVSVSRLANEAGGVTLITLNTDHQAYKHLVEIIEEIPDDLDVEKAKDILSKLRAAITLLFVSWAYYENHTLPDEVREKLIDVRYNWSRKLAELMKILRS